MSDLVKRLNAATIYVDGDDCEGDALKAEVAAEIERLTALLERKDAQDWEGFARAILDDWPTGDIDGAHLFDLSLKYGMIAEVPGGYDPEQHIDAEGICPEAGDPWFEYTFQSIKEPRNDQ